MGQYVFLSNDIIKTINGSRQLINPICRDLYKIISKEKEGFSFRIQNIRNLSERTVIFSELRGINLEDILYMEIYPERFLQATGKAVRSSSFKRGNRTAHKLIEMSKGNIDSDSQKMLGTPVQISFHINKIRNGKLKALGSNDHREQFLHL